MPALKSDTLDTVGEILHTAEQRLQEAGIGTPRLDAEVLLAAALETSRAALLTDVDREVTPVQREAFNAWMDRRVQREPVAYILGFKEFWSLDFQVTPEVLIPRPDTECLIEHFLSLVKRDAVTAPRILDVGTGSGVLAVVAARECPDATITAMELSHRALEVARSNAATHNVASQIQFVQGDFHREFWEGAPFDFILSNPPYIDHVSYETLAPEIQQYEPKQALDGGADGLDAYRKIIPLAAMLLKPGGSLVLEFGNDQGPEVNRLVAESAAFETIERVADYSGAERVLSAKRRQVGG
ncbi:peptide chain release factor N(5)-glutamine methyltransferase [Nitrospina watsonii]|uniref:Release factor glutamine methyltransferase n=1 Tax=Nitrospina watsonii TaxID=1323948 RepID=A0ABM9HGM9_9BACT|nr:peptide chain release factor N(5)-glutamine methyltransferase [Nitrospina watsonii]CAI2719407.1 Release factor glutamine methyltransferase [Nitrospina watsonii]